MQLNSFNLYFPGLAKQDHTNEQGPTDESSHEEDGWAGDGINAPREVAVDGLRGVDKRLRERREYD